MRKAQGARDLKASLDMDSQAFTSLAKAHRHELLVHCYRLLGSTLDAEDAVQEALLRAYRGLHTFKRPGSFRAWLYKIATNVCLNALERRGRTLPTLAFSAHDPDSGLPAPILEPRWVEPFPDEALSLRGTAASPSKRYETSEAISLAFITALQLLTPRQRAVLILRDVLDYRASEAAQILSTSPAAVESALHRARTRLARDYTPGAVPGTDLSRAQNRLLERYMQAWESADVEGLVSVLRHDATLSMPPWPVWLRGRAAIRKILHQEVFPTGKESRDRLRAVRANGHPGFVLYRQDSPADHPRAIGVQVLTLASRPSRIASLDIFLMPALAEVFGFPAELDA